MSITVTKTGGIFQASANAVIDRTIIKSVDKVADEELDQVRQRLASVLKHPTGRYESNIAKRRVTPYTSEVSDSGVVYGPWLEGVSSRNARTRFAGYATFRRTRQEVQRQVPVIIRDDIEHMVRVLR